MAHENSLLSILFSGVACNLRNARVRARARFDHTRNLKLYGGVAGIRLETELR